MSSKSLLKFVIAFGVLAAILIFLGVNYVPSIFASPSKESSGDTVLQARPNYVNERYQRSISPQLAYTGSDWLNHHPYDISQLLNYTGSDWIERHPSVAAQPSDYTGSDWLERHPSNYFSYSDWVPHQSFPQKDQ